VQLALQACRKGGALLSLRSRGMMDAQIFSLGRIAVFAVAGVAALAIIGCAPSSTDEDSDAFPNMASPSFVSLNPCTDAILVAVAEPEQILALSHYSQDPQSSSIAPDVAGRFAVTGGTAEEVFVKSPDVVLAGAFLPPATRQAFADWGMQVETFGIASEIEASFVQIRRIAALAGQPERGEALIGEISDAVSAGQQASSNAPVSAVLWQPGQIVPGENTLVAQLMERAGFTSHSAAQGLGQADYLSLEQLLADPPQVLLVAGGERAQRHPALANLNDTQIASFDPALLYCGGPTIVRAMERLRQIRQQAL